MPDQPSPAALNETEVYAIHGADPEVLAYAMAKYSRSALTLRESDVLRAVAFGFSIKEIAATLGITAKSVETYKIRACDKLALGSRAQIVRYALLQGWFETSASEADPPVTLPREPLWPSRP